MGRMKTGRTRKVLCVSIDMELLDFIDECSEYNMRTKSSVVEQLLKLGIAQIQSKMEEHTHDQNTGNA